MISRLCIRNKHNDTIKEEDSAMFETSQLDLSKVINNEASDKLLQDEFHTQAISKLEELKSVYKQKRKDGRLKNIDQ